MSLSFLQMLAVLLLFISVILSMARLLIGPTTADKLVATDTLAVISTAAIVVLAAVFDNPVYLDVALVYGTLAFVGTVALARSIEGKE